MFTVPRAPVEGDHPTRWPITYLVTENGPAVWLHYDAGKRTGRLVCQTQKSNRKKDDVPVQIGDLFVSRDESGKRRVFRAVKVERLQAPENVDMVDVEYVEFVKES